MDRWRSFFGRAGEDLWTIIEQAIILAATDYPQEFRQRRCDIAETLFARRSVQAGNEDTGATRLSGSVITNAITRTGTDDIRDDEHGAEHPSKPSLHSEYSEAEPLNNDLSKEALITQEVSSIRDTLVNSDQSESVVIDALQRLESLQIGVDALKATEIGKQVHTLRKHSSKRVRLLVKGLVRHWKELVDEWVNANQGAPDALGASGGCGTPGLDSDGHGLSTPLEDGTILSASLSPMRIPHPTSCMDDRTRIGHPYQQEGTPGPPCSQSASFQTDCSDYDFKVRQCDLELPEERGSSSRADHAGLDFRKRSDKRLQLEDKVSSQTAKDHIGTDSFGRSLVGKSSAGGLGPGRPLDVYKGRVGRPASETQKVDNPEKDSSQRNRNLKCSTTNQRPKDADDIQLADKLEAAKRKLHERYAQAENAKKQRVAQLIDLPDLPEGGPPRAKGVGLGQSAAGSRWNQSKR